MRLRALAPGKVNLCLLLGPGLPDGRHSLLTLMQSVSLADELVLRLASDGDAVHCPGVPGENLAARALQGLRRQGWGAPAVAIEIVKRVPVAAGMGGGSADAAAALRLAQELAPGEPEEIAALAAALGSDVPSQLAPGAVLATGAGDEVEILPPLAPHAYVIVPDRHELSTAEVYREADRLGLGRSPEALETGRRELEATLATDGRPPDGLLINDLQAAALSLLPHLERTLARVLGAGADHALVSGSGPTVAGLFWGADADLRAEEGVKRLGGLDPPAILARPVDHAFGRPQALPSPG